MKIGMSSLYCRCTNGALWRERDLVERGAHATRRVGVHVRITIGAAALALML
jgi:hypothetical protein